MNKLIVLVIFIFCNISLSQSTLKGSIKGSDNIILENVNVLAFPFNKDVKMSFTTTNSNGEFYLELQNNTDYKITLSHIGYITLTNTLKIKTTNFTKNYILQLDPNELDEVKLEYTPAIEIKKDTITYNVKKFTNGNERKLREILKKLPGVTVDKDGNVESQGKKVTQVLVENKKFFNGNSKMAVNNIPANVIKEVEIIDDYHETAFMKGIESSDEIALNINLLDHKKNFIFGDLEAGIGIKNRYKIHPSIFKYGKKATYNFIGDINNTDEKSFTIKDLIDFEGGFDLDNFSNVNNSGIAQFLLTQNFNKNNHNFGALNFQYNPNKKNELRFFAIGINDKSSYKKTSKNKYVTENNSEFREINNQNNLNALFSKLHYKYRAKNNKEFKLESALDVSSLEVDLNNKTQFSNLTFDYNNSNNINDIKFSIIADLKNKINKKNTYVLSISNQLIKQNTINNWTSEDNFFSSDIPIQNNLFYDIRNPQNTLNNTLKTKFKYYWIINRKTHLNFSFKNELLSNKYNYSNSQLLSNGNFNELQGFSNRTNNNYNKLNIYLEYKKIFGSFLIENQLLLEQNNWNSNQIDTKFKKSKTFLFPNTTLTWEPSNTKKLKISYKNESRFYNFKNSIIGNQIKGFNSIFYGNKNLPLEKYSVFAINYKLYRTYSISYYPSFTYRKRKNQITDKSIFNGIYNLTTPVVLNNTNESYYLRLRTKYNKKYYNIGFTPSYEIFNFKTIINNVVNNNKNLTFSTNLDIQTNFIEKMNYEFSLNYTNRTNTNNNLKNTINTTKLNLGLSHELNKWIFKINGSQTYFNGNNIFSEYNTLNCLIRYHKEDNPWSFELTAKNILNNSSKITSSFNGVSLNDEEFFVFPRYALFNVYFKL